MRISYSALDTYQTCPLKYKYREIDRIKEPKSKEAVFGTLLHSVMHYIHSPALVLPTLEEALNFFSQNWNADIWASELEERSAFSQGVKIIQDYYAKNDPADFTIVDLESRFSIEIGDEKSGTHIIAGIIDRIDKTADGYEIIDYKTAKKMPSQETVNTNLQLSIYLKAFLDRYPKERENLDSITVSLYFLKHGAKLSATRTEEQLAELDRIFLEVIASIEAGKFDPVLSPLCDWCGYQKLCPLWKHKFAEERKMDSIEARAAIDDYIAAKEEAGGVKRKLAELQERIFSYMENEGVDRVFGERGIVGKSLRRTYKYDEARLKEILAPLGRLDDVMKIDGIALKRVSGELSLAAKKEIEEARVLDKESVSLSVKKGTFLDEEDIVL
jgi:putative RecB family exonuclease